MPGVRIGDGAVVGASAVVTKEVGPCAVVAGVPARPMGRRFDGETAAAIAASRWWDWSHAEIAAGLEELCDVRTFLGAAGPRA